MPELGPNDLSNIKKLKERLNSWDYIHDMSELVKDYDQEYIGSGSESVVVRHKDKSDRLVAFNYRDIEPKRAKEIFYLQRVFSTLFPHNFPHFYASAGKDPIRENISGTVRKQVIGFKGSPAEIIYPFKKVEKILSDLEIGVSHDSFFENFIIGEDGGEYYVDTLFLHDPYKFQNVQNWNIDKIVKYMQDNKYTERDVDIVRTSIERLKSKDVKPSIYVE